jgi:hypothetical protein
MGEGTCDWAGGSARNAALEVALNMDDGRGHSLLVPSVQPRILRVVTIGYLEG